MYTTITVSTLFFSVFVCGREQTVCSGSWSQTGTAEGRAYVRAVHTQISQSLVTFDFHHAAKEIDAADCFQNKR